MILAITLKQAVSAISRFKKPTLVRVGGYWIVKEKGERNV